MENRKHLIFLSGFLLTELILYVWILKESGKLLVVSSFAAIALCFVYALVNLKKSSTFIVAGLACTVVADVFLVVCSPIQRLWGMVFFTLAQTMYAVKLHLESRNKKILVARVALTVAIELAAVIILKDKLDVLAAVSVCYYANLFVNIIEAFTVFKKGRLFAVGLVLFLLCDTVIGLQVMSQLYLQIPESSIVYKILFMPFNLSWFFYLPAQVLIALSGKVKRREE